MNLAVTFGEDPDADAPVEDPLELLGLWLGRAGVGGGIDSSTTPLMALATVDAAGDPHVRHVLLSAHDAVGLHFHTDAASTKAVHLAGRARAAASIVWPEIPRQVSVAGPVLVENAEQAARAYGRRTRYLQLLAWVNDVDLAQHDAGARRARFSAFDAAHPELEAPPGWVGYVLVPETVTFWRGGPGGPSQRIACERRPAGWTIARLPG